MITERIASGRTGIVRATAMLGLVASCGLAGGCIVVGGSTTKSPSPTVGQQLIDLHRAQQDGAITQEEYDRERSRLLRGDGT